MLEKKLHITLVCTGVDCKLEAIIRFRRVYLGYLRLWKLFNLEMEHAIGCLSMCTNTRIKDAKASQPKMLNGSPLRPRQINLFDLCREKE